MTIVWLILSVLLARWPMPARTARWARAGATVLAVAAGLTLPDLDQWLPFLDHRSALTHSLLPVVAATLAGRGVAAGLALGLGFHLAADCFPAAMIGYATVKLPVAGSIGAGASYGWLAINSLACTAWGTVALARDERPMPAAAVLAVGAWMGVAYLWSDPGGWPALAVYGLAGWWVWRRARGSQAI